jgi:hypothetical protein
VHATLRGENHAPKAGKRWHYVLKVTDASGRPLAGTVDVEFALGPVVVGHDTPPVHQLKNGMLSEVLTFPLAAIGHSISLQTVVHTMDGSVTLNWPVTATQ